VAACGGHRGCNNPREDFYTKKALLA